MTTGEDPGSSNDAPGPLRPQVIPTEGQGPDETPVPVPAGVIDAHVHIFPPRVFEAIWRWFDEHAWSIRYRLEATQIDTFLTERGITSYLGLHYAHKPGMAESLNAFVSDFCARHPRCIPCATVLPGEPDAERILDDALTAGARAVKIHAHVQCIAPDDPRMDAVYRQVSAHGALLVYHCGNEPNLPGYHCDIPALCTPAALARALDRYPELSVCVPHFGAGDIEAYDALLDRFPNLYLDTAMMLSSYFAPAADLTQLLSRRWQRILYGTDFPNIPYSWDRDLAGVIAAALPPAQAAAVLGGNARRLLRLEP